MRGPEGKIQDKILAHARNVGLLYKKNEVGRFFVSAGWPDVVFFPELKSRKSMPFFMEFKAPGKSLTPLQLNMKHEIESRGYEFFVVDSVEEGKKILDKHTT
jgi:hypothetical protein